MFKSKTIILFIFFSLLLIYGLSVDANIFGDYVSPESQKVDQRRTVSSGSRSNCQSNIVKNSISLLVPKQEVVHYTSLEQPTFFLATNELPEPKNFQFSLVDPQIGKTIVEKSLSVSEGIKQIKIPKSTSLQLNKIYLWYVAIPCTNNPEEYREVLTAAIKRVEPNQNVKNQLLQAKSNLKPAAIYAENGFWYEALEIAVRERNQDRKDTKANHSDYLAKLLHDAELNICDYSTH